MSAVIFDFNGTLFYDTDKHILAWRRFFLEETGSIPDDDAFKNIVIGSDNTTIFQKLINPDVTPDEVKKYSFIKENLYFDECLKDKAMFKFIDGAEDFFKKLSDAEITFGVATGSNKLNIEFYMKNLPPMKKWFSVDTNLVYDDMTVKGKPAPDIFLAAAKKIGADPKDCIIFEDSYPGYLAARAAGAKKIIMIEKKEDFHKYETLEGVTAVMENYLDTERLLSICK